MWPTFSKFIRLRDCIATTRTTTHGLCYTCGKKKKFSAKGGLQAGHFIPGRMDAILFDEEQVHAQCYRCNVMLGGNWPAYYEHMMKDVGIEEIHLMLEQRNDKVDFKREWFESTKDYYEQEIVRMSDPKYM